MDAIIHNAKKIVLTSSFAALRVAKDPLAFALERHPWLLEGQGRHFSSAIAENVSGRTPSESRQYPPTGA